MRQSLKIALSLLVSLVLFSAFAVLAFSGLFNLLEASFLQPKVRAEAEQRLAALAEKIQQFHQGNFARFSPLLRESHVISAFATDSAEELIFNRTQAFGRLMESYPNLRLVRFLDPAGEEIHFSTLAADYRDDPQAKKRSYCALNEVDPSLQPADLAVEKGSTPRLLIDGRNQRLVYLFPIVDRHGILRGSALFYVSAAGLLNDLYQSASLNVRDILLLDRRGVLANPPAGASGIIEEHVLAQWEEWKALDGPQSGVIVLDGGQGPPEPEEGGAGPQKASYLHFAVQAAPFGAVGLMMLGSEAELPLLMKAVLLVSFFLTVFLIVFLVLNLRQDPLVVIAERVKRFQLQLLQELIHGKEAVDWARWRRELASSQGELRARIKSGVGRLKGKTVEQVDQLIDRGWEEIISIIESRLQLQPRREGVDLQRIEEIIQKALSHGKIVPSADPGPREAGAVSHPAAQAPAPARRADAPTRGRDADALQAPVEVEEIGEEEVRELPAGSAPGGSTETLEELEAFEEAEELKEAPAEGEAAAPRAPLSPAEPAGPQAAPGPADGEPAELEELEPIEKPEEMGELEELTAVEPSGPADAPGLAERLPGRQTAVAEGFREIADLLETVDLQGLEDLVASESPAAPQAAAAGETPAGQWPVEQRTVGFAGGEAGLAGDEGQAESLEELEPVPEIVPLPPEPQEILEELQPAEEPGDEREAAREARDGEPIEDLEPIGGEPGDRLEIVEETGSLAEPASSRGGGEQAAAVRGEADPPPRQPEAGIEGFGNGQEPAGAVEFRRLLQEGKLLLYPLEEVQSAIEEQRTSVVMEDGVYRIREELYQEDDRRKTDEASPSGLEYGGFSPAPESGAEVSGIGDLFDVDGGLDLQEAVSELTPRRTQPAFPGGRPKVRRLYVGPHGIDIDHYLEQFEKPAGYATQVKVLADLSSKVQAVSAAILRQAGPSYIPELTIGLMDSSIRSLRIQEDEPFFREFLRWPGVLVVNQEIDSIGSLRGKLNIEDARYMNGALFLPILFQAQAAILFLAFAEAKTWDIKELIIRLNIF